MFLNNLTKCHSMGMGALLVALCGSVHAEVDSDGDGISDIEEAKIYRTDSQLPDTDTDGLADGLEIDEYMTDPLLTDTDGDGYLDGIEARHDSDPLDVDDIPKSNDLDGDGIPNKEEIEQHKTDAQRIDTDFDGLSDYLEIEKFMTNPLSVDTDGDKYWDGEEEKAGTDPTNPDNYPLP